MSSQNKFDIVISAVDRASKPLSNVNRSIEKMLRPIDRLNRSFKNMGKELHMDKAAKKISGLAKMTEKFGLSNPLIRGFAGGFALAGLVETIAKLTTNLGGYGTAMTRVQQRTGVGFKASQRMRGAARLMGLSPESMDSGLSNLSDTMRNAQFDPQIAMLFSKLGIKPVMKKDGTPDVAAMLPKLADAVAAQRNPAAAAAILNAMGLGELFPLLRIGSKALQDLGDKAERTGMVLSDDTIKGAEAFDRSLDLLKGNMEGMANQIGKSFMPAVQSGIDYINKKFDQSNQNDGKPTSFLDSPLNPFNWLSAGFEFGEALGSGGQEQESNGRKVSGRVIDDTDSKPNNPGNLRTPGGGGFQRFMNSQQGLQAMANQLLMYGNGTSRAANFQKLDTINSIISTYAPASDRNDVPSYVADVSRRTGFKPGQHLDLTNPEQLQALMTAMVGHEQGKAANAFTPQEFAQAVAAALKQAPIQVTVKGATGSQRLAFAMPSDGVR